MCRLFNVFVHFKSLYQMRIIHLLLSLFHCAPSLLVFLCHHLLSARPVNQTCFQATCVAECEVR